MIGMWNKKMQTGRNRKVSQKMWNIYKNTKVYLYKKHKIEKEKKKGILGFKLKCSWDMIAVRQENYRIRRNKKQNWKETENLWNIFWEKMEIGHNVWKNNKKDCILCENETRRKWKKVTKVLKIFEICIRQKWKNVI